MRTKGADAATRRSTGSGNTVLVVDDEAGIASLLVDLLESDGYRVTTAQNGRAALAVLEERSFDVILSDIRMPELDGPGLYREIEQQHPHLVGRLVFMTGNILNDETADFFAATGAPCLRKPFIREEVQRLLQQALAGPTLARL